MSSSANHVLAGIFEGILHRSTVMAANMDGSSEQTSATSDCPPSSENQGTSSGYDSSSKAESSSAQSDGIVCQKKIESECLKNATCLKGKRLNNRECLKATEALDSETSTEPCLKLKKNVRNNQKTLESETSDKDETSAASTSTGVVDSSAATSGNSSGVPQSMNTESGTEAGTQTDDAPQDSTADVESSKAATEDTSSEPPKPSHKKSSWNLSEDSALRGMKESGDALTWANIAAALGRNRDEVKARWKAIKDQAISGDSNKEQGAKGKEKIQTTEPKGKATSQAKGKAKANPKDTAKPKIQADVPVTPDRPINGKAVATPGVNEHNVTNGKAALGNKSSKKKTKLSDPYYDDFYSEEEESSEYSWTPYDPAKEKRREARYLQNHIYNELYPGYINPEPDEFFGPRDCEVLASIESKYQRSKWLEMQANFYNVTGRLVPIFMIKAKCESAAEEQRQEREAARQARQAAKRVEEWVKKLPDQGCEEPES